MPKYRKLYVKTTESLDINDMPDDFTRLMWVMMPLALCREGRGVDNPSWLKSKLFPLRTDVSQEQILDAMEWYEQRGMLIRYEVDGRGYFRVPTFSVYQGKTTRESASNYPADPDELADNSRPTQELVVTESSTDAICNIQYSDADTSAQESSPEHNPKGSAERVFVDLFGPFQSDYDRQDILAVETQIGSDAACEVFRWAKRKHITDNLIQAIVTAASKWDVKPPSNGPPPKGPIVLDIDLEAQPDWIRT